MERGTKRREFSLLCPFSMPLLYFVPIQSRTLCVMHRRSGDVLLEASIFPSVGPLHDFILRMILSSVVQLEPETSLNQAELRDHDSDVWLVCSIKKNKKKRRASLWSHNDHTPNGGRAERCWKCANPSRPHASMWRAASYLFLLWYSVRLCLGCSAPQQHFLVRYANNAAFIWLSTDQNPNYSSLRHTCRDRKSLHQSVDKSLTRLRCTIFVLCTAEFQS